MVFHGLTFMHCCCGMFLEVPSEPHYVTLMRNTGTASVICWQKLHYSVSAAVVVALHQGMPGPLPWIKTEYLIRIIQLLKLH